MPFPVTLPTTSSFSFSAFFTCDSHPSLPLSASTYRGVLRDALKKHKRLPPLQQSSHLSSILSSLTNYVPYLLAIDDGLGNQPVAGEEVDVVLKTTPILEWRATLSDSALPGREPTRLKIRSLEYEIYFVLSTLAYTYTLLSRVSLHPLYSSATESPSEEQRKQAIQSATKHLLNSASIHEYLSTRSDQVATDPPCADITKSTFSALKALALAEATLLAVLKDDPYPAAVAQDRNRNDREWMIRAPQILEVRAHLFARLCLAASEHAANALSLLSSSASKGQSKINTDLLKYVEDLRRTSRGKAFRFFAIDAEKEGHTGTGIAWLQAGLHELGIVSKEEGRKGLGLGRFRKDWSDKREDKRIEKGAAWGSDAGKSEEGRILDMLEKKWTKMNDTINTQVIPAFGPLIASVPSGREMYKVDVFSPPALESSLLETMRAPPDRIDDYGSDTSSINEEDSPEPVGAFPGTNDDYKGASSSQYY